MSTITEAGSSSSDAAFVLTTHRGKEGLVVIKTESIFCCPPIPRELPRIAKEIIPESIMRLNHDQRHLIALFPEDDTQVWIDRIKGYSEEVFLRRSPWTGYIIYENKGPEIIGLCAFNVIEPIVLREKLECSKEREGLKSHFEPAPVDKGGDTETAEIEIDYHIIPGKAEYFEEIMIVMLTAAQRFIYQGYTIRERPVGRIVVWTTAPVQVSPSSPIIKEALLIKKVMKKIFGDSIAGFHPVDPRNRSGRWEQVFGCEVSKIHEITRKYFCEASDCAEDDLSEETACV